MSRCRQILCVPLALAVFLVPSAPAQEHKELGRMWTFENPPLDYFKKAYDFTPTQKWLDHVRLSSVRFGGGCSASFVSPRGLIMTNHHCVRDRVRRISPPEEDWVRDGFVARMLKDEVAIPGLTVQQLVSMEDVTARVNAGITPDEDPATAEKRRRSNIEEIKKQARRDASGLSPQVVSLYQGGMYQLYLYRIWDDIRLVATPHLQSAKFGGDPDNFTYPRFGLDFAFCRAYVDGKPADTSGHYFRWNESGLQEGDLVFVSGNPGSTGRLNTLAQMEYRRDIYYPRSLEIIHRRLEDLRARAARGPRQERALRTRILGLENQRKAYQGYLDGLRNPKVLQTKARAEARLRARVEADPRLKARYGSAWKRLEEISREKIRLSHRLRHYSDMGSPLLGRALLVVQATDSGTPGQRREQLARRARRQVVLTDESRRKFTAGLEEALKRLGSEDPLLGILLDGQAPAQAARSLAGRSRIEDDGLVAALLEGGAEAVAKSSDPAVRAARLISEERAKAMRRMGTLRAEERAEAVRVGRALFEVYGTAVSPDATFTLRLSDGVVRGFPMNGTIAPWFTSFYGLYARNVEFGNKPPFNLPDIWLKKRSTIDLSTPFNFVSTNDIIGGNSGSPVLNRKGEIVGLVFDGNIQSLANRYVFHDDIPRAVSVHTAAITEALRKVYRAPRIIAELRWR